MHVFTQKVIAVIERTCYNISIGADLCISHIHSQHFPEVLMFTTSDFDSIDRTYFDILKNNEYCITLKSRNTGHFWHIILLEYSGFTSCNILHKHKPDDDYHKHGHAPNLKLAIDDIMSHDEFQLGGRKKKKKLKKVS